MNVTRASCAVDPRAEISPWGHRRGITRRWLWLHWWWMLSLITDSSSQAGALVSKPNTAFCLSQPRSLRKTPKQWPKCVRWMSPKSPMEVTPSSSMLPSALTTMKVERSNPRLISIHDPLRDRWIFKCLVLWRMSNLAWRHRSGSLRLSWDEPW